MLVVLRSRLNEAESGCKRLDKKLHKRRQMRYAMLEAVTREISEGLSFHRPFGALANIHFSSEDKELFRKEARELQRQLWRKMEKLQEAMENYG
jgi:hypothetical protein